VTNLTKSTIVFVEPVQECFGKCHEGSTKPEKWSTRPLNTVCKIDIYDVENSLNNIHESWMRASTINWVHKRERKPGKAYTGHLQIRHCFPELEDHKPESTVSSGSGIPKELVPQTHIVNLSKPQPEDIFQ